MDGKGEFWSITVAGFLVISIFSGIMATVPRMTSAYTPSSPIYIQSNLDFNAGHGVVSGTGTELDPYVIDGWEIVTTDYGYGIIVANTDKYFTIRNCYIHGVSWDGSHAIYMTDVRYGSVEDCLLTDSHRGIDVRTSACISITGCNISGCGYGIYSEASDNIDVSFCQIQGNSIGFSQQGSACSNCTFTGNNFTGNAMGIIAYPAKNYSIEGNNLSENGGGISLGACDDCLVSDNLFERNIGGGLSLSGATNMTMTSNIFVDDGMHIWGEDLTHWNSHVIGTDNLVNGLPLLYLKNNESVSLDGEQIGALILANCTESHVTNLTMTKTYVFVSAGYSDRLVIENSTLADGNIGVFLNLCSYASVLNNSIINVTVDLMSPGVGVNAYHCPSLRIIGNNISHPDIGVYLQDCPDVHIEGNDVAIGNYAGGIGAWRSDNALLLSNNVSLKDGGISWGDSHNLTMIGNTISKSVNEAMYLENITDLIMEMNEFVDNGFGPRFSQIVNASITQNHITGTFCSYAPSYDRPCLQLSDSENIELMGNFVNENENGLYMYNCGFIDIIDNEFSLEETEGIYLEWCHDLSISSNNMSSNLVNGIHLRSCYGIQSVADNLVLDNTVGIYIDQSSPEIIRNTIATNDVGMELVASSVMVYNNDFIENADHVSASDSMFSRWNESYPIGGNYWSDYSGSDQYSGPNQDVTGADGIGDTPYPVSLDFEDSYPLVRPVNVPDAEPIAFFTVVPSIGNLASVFEFDASGVWDREDSTEILEVRWDWESDGVWDTIWSTDKTEERQYTEEGEYTIRLEVMDAGFLTSNATRQIIVDETPPIADAGPDQNVAEDTMVALDGSGSTDNIGIANYSWSFIEIIDGNEVETYLMGEDSTIVFENPGEYIITLMVLDFTGLWNTDNVTIRVSDITPPTADAGPNQTVDEDSLVTFDGSGSSDNVDIVNYTWTFTDGNAKTLYGVSPTYAFVTPGTYAVTLNVTDTADNWDTDDVVIVVEDATPPEADAGPNQTVDEDTLVTFDGSGSSDNVDIVNYTWILTDGTTKALYGVSPTYAFETPGTYTVMLNVTDAAGIWDADEVTITVNDTTIPSANAGPDQNVAEDTIVALDGSGSTDNFGIADYSWNFTEIVDGVEVETYLMGELTTIAFQDPGEYVVTLMVVDFTGLSDTDSVTIRVADVTPPIADAGLDQTVDEDTLVTFDGSGSSDNVDIVNYTWSFTYEGYTVDLYGETPTFRFERAGVYTVTLTVEDAVGRTSTDVVEITVEKKAGISMLAVGAIGLVIVAIVALALFMMIRKKKPPHET